VIDAIRLVSCARKRETVCEREIADRDDEKERERDHVEIKESEYLERERDM
jgi:hypothetical protein